MSDRSAETGQLCEPDAWGVCQRYSHNHTSEQVHIVLAPLIVGSNERVALTLRLDKAQHERLRNTAHVLRRPISELIREAIDKTHFHAAGVWCDDCPPPYRVPSMSVPPTVPPESRAT